MGHDSSKNDIEILKDLEIAILRNVGGRKGLENNLPLLIRRAIDEVIDTARTGRRTIDEIEQPEKTYIGTKIEILFRTFIGYPKGILDLNIDGKDVDIKNTIRDNWMIPPEAHNKPCVLIKSDEKEAVFSLGVIMARSEYLTKPNRDGKSSISSEGKKHIHWILKDHPYPCNFWETVSKETIQHVFEPKGGTNRLIRLFTEVRDMPISRMTIEGIAQQLDPMKRIRKNGGARDFFISQGIVILSGKYDKELIKKLNLPACAGDEFISFQATTREEKMLLKDKLT